MPAFHGLIRQLGDARFACGTSARVPVGRLADARPLGSSKRIDAIFGARGDGRRT